MSKTPKCKENFPLFDELAPMLAAECREEVRKTMQLLENAWRDDLCKATIVMITKGKRKVYKKSRVMRTMFSKVIKTLSNSPLKGEGFIPGNSNNR